MEIRKIIGMTRDIGKPLNWDEATMGPCASLPVRDEVIGKSNCMISAHSPTPEDLAKMAAGEPLLLGIYGTVHPVIFMTVGYDPAYVEAHKAEFEAEGELFAESAENDEAPEISEVRADVRYMADLFEKFRITIESITDEMVDEGGRVYFGSTNHADDLKEVSEKIEGLAFDRIMRGKKQPDLYADLRSLRTDIEKVTIERDALKIQVATDIGKMVDRFLAWSMPEDFNPDGGITFKPAYNEGTEHEGQYRPTGTNLLTATQARQMIEHLLAIDPAASSESAQVPDDVAELVIAARIVAFEDQSEEALRQLDKASEAFASRVPWENDPNDEASDDRPRP